VRQLLQPAVIVVVGDLGEAHEQLLAGIREVTFQRSLPLATQELVTVPSRLGDRAGIIGAAIMVIEYPQRLAREPGHRRLPGHRPPRADPARSLAVVRCP
jgi:predicted NBD/HSP70 family sugar kinase